MNALTPGPRWLCGVVIFSLVVVTGCGKQTVDPVLSIAVADADAADGTQGATSRQDSENGERDVSPAPYEINLEKGELPEAVVASPTPAQSKESRPNTSGMSDDAMRIAAYDGRTSAVERGLDGGIDVNSADPGKKHTALHMAAYNGHTDTVRFLLSRGAEIDSRDNEGKTPLSHACTGPFAETVQLLVDKGADVNAKDGNEGFTPLMMAAALNQPEIVKILLANGADKDAEDDDKDKAIDHARRENLTEVVKLLE